MGTRRIKGHRIGLKMNSSRICGVTLCVVLWGAFAIVGQALADGFERGVVNGEAVADDAMTAATNPAGMAFLRSHPGARHGTGGK